MSQTPANYSSAIQDFHRARRRSALERILARLRGKSADLLSYEEVRKKLKIQGRKSPTLKEIPLDEIVGSVDRYTDFTRSFLPKDDADAGRWAGVKLAVSDLKGLPPIDVYQIGDVYFVEDGNHRVSVARELGQDSIEAYVTELVTKVSLKPDVDIDDLILKAEYVDFLEHTRLDQSRPQVDLALTVPGGYRILEEHIAVHRHFLGLEQQREISYGEAAAHWYDQVYMPVVHTIREQGILRDFPGRTETDLYLWVSEHRAALQDALQMEIDFGEAASDLAARRSSKPERVLARVSEKVLEALIPDEVESGPPPGAMRKETNKENDSLFADLLVPVSGDTASFNALDQALVIAWREAARIYGLHVVPAEAEKESEVARSIKAEFERRCIEAGVTGNLILAEGEVPRAICDRARWTDLVVLNVSFPPPSQPLARLGSGISTAIRRCPRPILAVPNRITALDRVLLAYDGSPKAQEALYIACYLTSRWKVPMVVLSVAEHGRSAEQVSERAWEYLEGHGVEADVVVRDDPVVEAILQTAEEQSINMLVLGGYGHTPMPEIVLGSVVDEVLRTSRLPVLICR
jgi:nucleotide-binding universal stress UspA family protein